MLDTLEGGAGNDTLIGSYNTKDDDNSQDTLKGGDDYDTYIAGDGDIIEESKVA